MNFDLQEKLKGNDKTLFMEGACHVFADELLVCLSPKGFALRRLADTNRASPQQQALHVYLLQEAVMFDVNGMQSEAKFILERQDYRLANGGPMPNFRSFECSRDELFTPDPDATNDESGPRNKWRHVLDPEFVGECRRRAHDLIVRYSERYNPV